MKKKYKFKYSALFIVLFGVIYALALTALIWNGIRLYTAISEKISLGVYNTISLVISLILPIILIVIITSAFITSSYTLNEESLTVNYGLLKETFKIKDITSIIKNVKYSTLVVSFADGNGYKIVIDEKEFDDFSATLIKLNKDVSYGETDEEIKKK